MAKMEQQLVLGEQSRKCEPRLRMIANGSAEVNTVRAEQVGYIAVTSPKLLDNIPLQLGEDAVPVRKRDLPPQSAKIKSLKNVASNIYVNVFIETLDATAPQKRKFRGERARRSNLVTARVRLSDIAAIAGKDNVIHIELGEPLAPPAPIVSPKKNVEVPSASKRQFGTEQQRRKAQSVLIGIIDVQGFDFSHPDFLDSEGKTRFESIWDQGGTTRPSPKGNPQFDYGSEFRREHLNTALAEAPRLKIPAYELERQSQMAVGSHGTHVASIAAGNRGVCLRIPVKAITHSG